MKEVILRGERLRNILSSSLVGVRGPRFTIGLKNTSVDSIPAALFFPVPRSTQLELDVTGNRFTTLSPPFLAALDERTGSVKIKGLRYNSISCNCGVKQLWKWAHSDSNRRHPGSENGVMGDGRNNGGNNTMTTAAATGNAGDIVSSSADRPTYSEPEIIWTVAPAVQNADRNKHYKGDHTLTTSTATGNIAGTDDTLIIGIVGGVVAFIAVIVIVICVCRIRWSSRMDQTRLGAPIAPSSIPDASMIRPASVYSGKMNPDIYLGSYNGSTLDRGNAAIATSIPTTPIQMMPFVQPPMHFMHTLLTPGAHSQAQLQSQAQMQPHQYYGYCDTSLPMYVTCTGTFAEQLNHDDRS